MKVDPSNIKRRSKRLGKVFQERERKGRRLSDLVSSDKDLESQYEDNDSDGIVDAMPSCLPEPKTQIEETKVSGVETMPEPPVPGAVCDKCSNIGIFTQSEEVQRVIKLSTNRRRAKDKCLICKTYQNRNYNEGHFDISETLIYSHDFYDKFQRDKKTVDTAYDTSEQKAKADEKETIELKDEETNQPSDVQNDDEKSDNKVDEREEESSPWPTELEEKILDDANDAGIKRQVGQFHLTKSRKKNTKDTASSKIPTLPKIKSAALTSSFVEEKTTVSKALCSARSSKLAPEKEVATTKLPVLTMSPPKKDLQDKTVPKAPTALKRYSEMYINVHQKRVMKGSTVRKTDALSRIVQGPMRARYAIECLGLTFGIPEFNFRLTGRPLHKPSSPSDRPTSLDVLGKKKPRHTTLLPPLGKSVGQAFPLGSSS